MTAYERVIAAYEEVTRLTALRVPYIFGGGHNAAFEPDPGLDCSGLVSRVLHVAGLLGVPHVPFPLATQALEPWGEAGPGRWLTVWDRDVIVQHHCFLQFSLGPKYPLRFAQAAHAPEIDGWLDPNGQRRPGGTGGGRMTTGDLTTRAASGGAGRGSDDGPPRGRPRSEKARQAILAAAAELLLARGLGAVSMDAVADRAGVSKATIYRWWPTKETLALDALYTEWATATPAPRDTGSLRGDLLSLLRPWAGWPGSCPYGRVIAGAAHRGPDRPGLRRGVPPARASSRAATRPGRSSAAPSTAARSPPAPRPRSRSTSSTARSTTGCCTVTPRSTTGSSATSSTSPSPASSPHPAHN